MSSEWLTRQPQNDEGPGAARIVISDWKDDYNHRRRHSSLGYQAPVACAASCTHR
ncbi:integrase core domain-containing protein [Streptosporangium sp. CA-115845]|uniref:integrase core domain-containing protein n=1 Tax=Streptosporangium sp. CA-115845 TaxID=3240071 RepID=UPI003D9125F9